MSKPCDQGRQEVAGLSPSFATNPQACAAPGIDEAHLLKEIESWRESLAANMALRNADLSADDLNAAVQLTIDRVVFLRMAEDRGLEPHGQLLKLCAQPDSYARFVRRLCRRADQKYNSGLFHCDQEPGVSEAPDPLTSALSVDDKVFAAIIESLYVAYVRMLPVELLGAVYERFLGKAIRLTAGHQARVEEKPEVRKAGGVYYTPAYIVDYIVRETVGRHIAGKSPAQLAGRNGQPPLRVLDLACGSGSFLLGVYQCLLDHCLQWSLEHDPSSHKGVVCQPPRQGAWQLTIAERKRILTTHIFGVDLDPRAVEVSRLSLSLKALEGEDDATRSRQLRLLPDRVLPNLTDNIKGGNALIEPDFCADQRRGSSDREPLRTVNGFDWQAEFRPVMAAGGFDVVVGNPPYVNARTLFQEQGAAIKRFFARRYTTARRGYDLYVLFQEKSLELLRKDGRCGMIVPNKIATLDYAEACRALLLEQTTIERITDVSGLGVFPTAGVYPYILVWRKTPPSAKHAITVLHARHEQDLLTRQNSHPVPQRSLTAAGGFAVHGTLDVESRVATQPLAGRAKLHSGTTGFAARQMADSLCEQPDVRTGEYFQFVVSGNIDRYSINVGNVRFMNRQFIRPVLPADRPHLTENKRRLFGGRKLVIAGMTKRLEVALDDRGGLALGVSVYAATDTHDDLLYLLGLLNSKLLSHLFRIRFQAKHLAGGFLAINKGQLAKLPIRVIDFAASADKRMHDQVVALAERMTLLAGQRGEAPSERVKEILERQITSTDAELDRVVYELYGLTDDEIRSVEEPTAASTGGHSGPATRTPSGGGPCPGAGR